MSPEKLLFRLLFAQLLGVLLLTTRARADDTSGGGEPPERAALLQSQQATSAALASGENDPAQLLPLYVTLARASALLHDEDAARTAFIRVLALAPDFRPTASESDVVRSRYLEARGFWAGQAVPLQVEASLSPDRTALLVRVVDPANLAARVRVRVRRAGATQYSEQVRAPRELTTLPMAGLDSTPYLELSLSLLDEHGNRVWQKGSDAKPERLVLATPTGPAASTSSSARPHSEDSAAARRRFLALASASGVLGVGAAAGAVWAHLEREQSAKRWNEGDCSGSGNTRAEICQDEQQRVEKMDRVMGALYGAAGAALVGSLVLFVLTPAREQPPSPGYRQISYRCQQGPGQVGVSCLLGF